MLWNRSVRLVRAVLLWAVVLVVFATSVVASATPVFDDFSSDTSSSYVGSDAVGVSLAEHALVQELCPELRDGVSGLPGGDLGFVPLELAEVSADVVVDVINPKLDTVVTDRGGQFDFP